MFLLRIKSLFRAILHHLFEWGLLLGLYVFLATLVIRPMAELMSGESWKAVDLYLLILGYLVFVFVLSQFPGGMGIVARGRCLLRHEVRRTSTWLGVVLAGGFVLTQGPSLLVFIVGLLPLQQSLMRTWQWRVVYAGHYPSTGGTKLVDDYLVLSLFFAALWGILGLVGMGDLERGALLACGHLGAALAGASCTMEGDSGQPFLVNLVVLVAGALGGLSSYVFPLALVGWIWFFSRMRVIAKDRTHSLQWPYEDLIIS